MKKFLSLVLALVMTFSLVTVSAGAKEYTDDSTIKYGKAVDVISDLGIVDGYANGAFNPSNTLTRGAAAKIICNLRLGPTAAAALGATAAPFSDVPANHTFAGYIAYCSEQGIINGYGDGTFKPAATVTGYQFLKMLLGALGYDAEQEKFTGSNWTVRVAALAIENKLTDGNEEFVGSKALTREEACLYAFNTLTARTVEYTNGTNVSTSDGTTVTVNAQRYYVTNLSTDGYKASGNDGYQQFCEKYFPKLKLTSVNDKLDRPSDKWSYKNAEIGTYAKTPYVTYTAYKNNTSGKKEIKSDLSGMSYADNLTFSGNVTSYNSDTVTSSDDIAEKTANGRAVEVYVTDNVITDVVVLKSELVTVKKVKSDEVTLSGRFNAVEDDDDLWSFFSGLKKDDKVIVIADGNDVIEAYEAKTVSGKYTKASGSGATVAYTVDGTAYQVNGDGSANALANTSNINNSYKLYVDQYGYVMSVTNTDSDDDVYALVLDYTANTNRGNYDYAFKLLFTDGTQKWVDVAELNDDVVADDEVTTGEMSDVNGHFVSYTVNADGKYVIDDESANQGDASGTITKGETTIFGNVTATNATVFLVKASSGNTYTVYNGIKNVPSMTVASKDAKVLTIDGVATVVVIDKNATTGASDQVFIYSTETQGSEKDGSTVVVYYKALVNGEYTTIGVSDAAFIANPVVGLYVNNDYTKEYISSTMASKLVDTSYTDNADIAVFDQAREGLSNLKLKNGVLTIDKTDDKAYVVADEFNAYVVNNNKKMDDLTIDETDTMTAESITLAAGDYVIVTFDDDGYVTNLYLYAAGAAL